MHTHRNTQPNQQAVCGDFMGTNPQARLAEHILCESSCRQGSSWVGEEGGGREEGGVYGGGELLWWFAQTLSAA